MTTEAISADEREWQRIEREQAAEQFMGPSCNRAKVHPKGYRPDLPTLSNPAGALAWADGIVRREAKTKQPAPVIDHLTGVTLNKPHPRSNFAHLPLRRFTDAQLTKATKEDKAIWAARPLTIIPNAFVRCEHEYELDRKTCELCHGEGIRRRVSLVADAPAVAPQIPVVPIGTAVVGQALAEAFGMTNLPNTVVVPSEPMAVKPAKAKRAKVCPNCGGRGELNHSADDGVVMLPCRMCSPRKPRETSTTRRPQSERDAIRRAYIALLKGRVSFDGSSYAVRLERNKSLRVAPWDAIVRNTFPTPDAFRSAAESWQSPRNQRTLATH